jgi:uncharacterized protein (TIGR02145 family)
MFYKIKHILILIPLFFPDPEVFSQIPVAHDSVSNLVIPDNPDTVVCADQVQDALNRMVRFNFREEGVSCYYVRLSLLQSEFERLYFYERARDREIYIIDKDSYHDDSALFISTLGKEKAWQEFRQLYQSSEDANSSCSEIVKTNFVRSSPFYNLAHSRQPGGLYAPLGGTNQCSDASVACSGNTYTFPAGTFGTAPTPAGGYPNYGCLHSTPCPAWYYMQVSVPGDIIIGISQSDNHDVDFVCWGPFTSLTDGCATGLTGTCTNDILKPPLCCDNTSPGCANFYPRGNITDCSYSPAATETCHILNAQAGEMYILLITNFSQQPGMITFSQTGGTGVTNCNIVVFCSMIAITSNPSACNPVTNTFSVSGNIEFSNPSPTGFLTITDNTAVPPISQSFSPPFISPLPYNLTNIPCDGATHLLTAVFSDSLNCNLTHQFTAPEASCPLPLVYAVAPLSVCPGTTGVTISVNPDPTAQEYHFSYNPPQAGVTITQANPADPVITISFSSTATSGFIEVYGTNAFCITPGPTTQLPVTITPLPVLNFPPFAVTCLNGSAFPLTTATPAGGTYSGPGVSGGLFTPASAGIGTHTIIYTYTDGNGCTNSTSQTIQVAPLPVITFNFIPDVCVNQSPVQLTEGLPIGGIYSGPGVTGGIFTPSIAGTGTHSITYTYTDGNGCTSSATQTIHVNALPSIQFGSMPDACVDQAPFPLNAALPVGGVYSGPGVASGIFHPDIAGVGIHPITYMYTDANGCVNSSSNNIQVFALPFVDFSGPVVPETVCQDYPNPSGYQVPAEPLTTYTWTIPEPYNNKGVVVPVPGFQNMTGVNWTETGNALLKLEGLTSKGCLNFKIKEIFINPKPEVSLQSCFDPVTIHEAAPFILHGGTPLGPAGMYSGTGVTFTNGKYQFNPADAGEGLHTITYTYTNAYNCPSSDTKTILIVSTPPFQCGNALLPLQDVRTNPYKTYTTYWQGNRCWMTRNLDYGTELDFLQPQTDNCQAQKYCLSSLLGGCAWGGFYQWDEIMQYGIQEGSQGLCPPGWHLPSSSEWQAMIDDNQGNGLAGGTLQNAGFNALLNGIFYGNNLWAFTSDDNLHASIFWTSTLYGGEPVSRGINSVNNSVSLYVSSKANAFQVRCVKNQ